ncbi:MAG: hypothetical protein LBV17_09070 [Treponema sp.]|jgi:hypothetical protein|nr:hypothetical protein [Treponema sp.]
MKQTIMILISFITLCFSGCKNENKLLNDFFENEKQNLTVATKEAVIALGVENFEVLVYAHKCINNGIVSKNTNYTYWSGQNFTPETPSGVYIDNNIQPAIRNSPLGRMVRREMVANYELNSKKEITYDYFSILIIIENISNIKNDELLGILNSYIINVDRGDNVTVISKEDFNKL